MAGNFDFGIDEMFQSSQSSIVDEEEMAKMERESVPDSTNKATKTGVNKLKAWMKKRNIDINFHSVTAGELANTLRQFYAEVKKDNGKPLTPSSLVGIRAAINRYLLAAPFYRKLNIVSGEDFVIANKMFDAKCKLYYKANNPKPKHKPVIGSDDMKIIGQYFKNYHQNPVILTEAVWFFLCFHFGRRGREGWSSMTKDFFTVSEDGEFVECSLTETSKNNQGGHKQSDQDYSQNRMCGEAVQIFKFFKTKLNTNCNRLFQYPLNSFLISSDCWYANKPIGKNTLSQMMQRISEKCRLSKIYTCHSVRASCISVLFQAGVSTEKIISITRHKNNSSLKHYISGMSNEQKEHCSSILSSSVFDQSVSKPPVSCDVNEVSSVISVVSIADMSLGQTNGSSVINPAQSENNVSSRSGVVASTSNGMIAKYSELIGSCTFNNCELKFN